MLSGMTFAASLPNAEILSHAYLLQGDDAVREVLEGHLAQIGLPITGNPDAYVRTYAQFGIEESRELKRRSAARPLQSVRNIFLIQAGEFTREAQHALLKTLEEPQSHSTFFIVTKHPDLLLPTLRSRMQEIRTTTAADGEQRKTAEAFLGASTPVRLTQVEQLAKERNVVGAEALLTGLEQACSDIAETTMRQQALRALYDTRRYLYDRGASLKLLLERLALLMPRQ